MISDTRFARFHNRRAMLDKERALTTARNPGDSKYGNALFRNKEQDNRMHSAELSKLERALKRSQVHFEQEKKQFLQKHSQRDPILIVVRPPSPEIIKRVVTQKYEMADPEYGRFSKPGEDPGYMKPLRSRVKTPNLRPTIDAFCLQTKKKVNLWEAPMLEREKPKFRSTVMPSWPLTQPEVEDLIHGAALHKQLQDGSDHSHKKKRKKRPRQIEHYSAVPALPEPPRKAPDTPETPREDSTWQFITQVQVDAEREQASKSSHSASVRQTKSGSSNGTQRTNNTPNQNQSPVERPPTRLSPISTQTKESEIHEQSCENEHIEEHDQNEHEIVQNSPYRIETPDRNSTKSYVNHPSQEDSYENKENTGDFPELSTSSKSPPVSPTIITLDDKANKPHTKPSKKTKATKAKHNKSKSHKATTKIKTKATAIKVGSTDAQDDEDETKAPSDSPINADDTLSNKDNQQRRTSAMAAILEAAIDGIEE